MASAKTRKKTSSSAPKEDEPSTEERSEHAEAEAPIVARVPEGLLKAGAGKKAAPAKRTLRIRVRRQDAVDRPETRRFDEFEVPIAPRMNVHGALEQIRLNPVTTDGRQVDPPVWEASCLEEVCGSCTMLINGKVGQACSALIDKVSPKGERITLEPLQKFPCERDLVVDRSRMFEALKSVRAWIDLDGTHALGPGPRESSEQQEIRYELSRCITCGSCLEACPEYGEAKPFVGAQAINQVRLMNLHPSGKLHKTRRLETVMGEGGITDCGKAQNCLEVCPKGIPLVDSIGAVARDTTKQLLFGWLLK